ncbi:MAG: hypothetical protein A2W35_02710 [Chloroflexi bacterium RBG_16_57_11]|nr:MAG: hypothetical protein A2W35_02710 [Chloroflexi bacterium RBG_16_57_11]
MPTLTNIIDEANRLMDEAQREHLRLRLIGGLAVRIHSSNLDCINTQRIYPDIDFVVDRHQHRRLAGFFCNMGYLPDKSFNTLNGGKRQIYYDNQIGRHIDIFVGDFEMCHRLPLKDRLSLHPVTLPLAELFLTKTQIVELNHKDALDLIALLLNNEVGDRDDGMINLDRMVRLCARDWGLYTTTMINLGKLEQILATENPGLSETQTHLVSKRIQRIRNALQSASKPLLWKARDRVGTRLRWYVDVEEVDR